MKTVRIKTNNQPKRHFTAQSHVVVWILRRIIGFVSEFDSSRTE